ERESSAVCQSSRSPSLCARTDMQPPSLLLEDDFLPDSLALFDALATGITWDERMRARKTATFGVPYDYSGMTYPAVPMHPLLVPVVDRLESLLGFRFNNCLVNYYPDGNATMGFHYDSTAELEPGTGVAVVSLGAERPITFQSRHHKQIEHEYLLKSGSLL